MKKWLLFIPVLLLCTAFTASADIVITEIMQNPSAVGDSDGEYFEIYNTGPDAVDMENWEVHDNGADGFIITGSQVIEADAYFVFGTNADMATNGGVPVDYEYSGLNLANGDDEVIIIDTNADVVDQVWYDGGPNFPDPSGASMALLDPYMDNMDGANWLESTVMWPTSAGDLGTPGLPNNWTPPEPTYPDDLQDWSVENWNGNVLPDWLTTPTYYTLAESNDPAFHGNSAAMITQTEGTFNGILAQQINAVFPGMDFCGSAWVLDNDFAGKARLYVDAVDGDGNLVLEADGAFSSDNTEWQELTLNFTMPADAVVWEFGVEIHPDGGNWDGDAVIYVDAVNAGPMVSVADIQTNTDLVGHRVCTDGVFTQGTGTVHVGYVDAYLQDDSGYGVMVYDSAPEALFANRGDGAVVHAEVDQYFDVTELVDFLANVTSSGNDLPDPMVFQPVYFTDAIAYEGVWAEVSGTVATDPGTGSYNLEVGQDQAAGNNATVRIWEDAGLDLSGFSVGDNIRVRGTMDVYFGEAQLQPSEAGDIEAQLAALELDANLSTSQIMPAEGGEVAYIATLTNFSNNVFPGVTAWRTILAPNGNEYGPQAVFNFNIPANTTVSQENITFNLPPFAPAGNYQVFQHIGPSTNNSVIWDHMGFEKEAGAAADSQELTNDDFLTDAQAGEWVASDELAAVSALPTDYAVGNAYPNPFNPTTAISIALPSASEMTLRVYNVMGQQVAELANGHVAAGTHQFTFDASQLSSGVYFLHAQVPGELNELRKVTLMK